MIKRAILPHLQAHLSQKEISLIVGPRQAGKTTLMFILRDLLERRGEKTVFLNLDVEADGKFFVSQEALLDKVRLEIGQKGTVFIDEVQRKENAGLFLKGIYDLNLPYKLVVSGSGSIELKEKIHESLAGRKRVFELSTLSFDEFVNYKTDYKYEDRMSDFLALEETRAELLLNEYLNFGGYPRVVLSETIEEKRKVIDEIYRSYLEKDIYFLLGVKKGAEFSDLVRILASQTGSLVNNSELSRTVGLSAKTLKEYIWYLEKTFVLQRVTPFFKNLRKEITKAPVIYFCDTGLRNYALGYFGHVDTPQATGFLFQNFIFNILKEKTGATPHSLHFWRTKDGAEVDFVIDMVKTQVPIEVKYRSLKKPELSRGFRSFLEKYKPARTFIVNISLEKSLPVGQTDVIFVPYYKLAKMLEDLKIH